MPCAYNPVRKLTPDERTQARAAYAAGRSIEELADDYRASPHHIRMMVAGARSRGRPRGVSTRSARPSATPQERERIIAAYPAGTSAPRLAAELGMSVAQVYGVLRRAGIARRAGPKARFEMSPETERQIVDWSRLGYSPQEIVAGMELPRRAVFDVLRRADLLPMGPRPRSNPTWKLDGHEVETEYDPGVPGWYYQIKGWGHRTGPYPDENLAMRDAVKQVAELWHPIAVLGDVNPIEHDGGILYRQGDPPKYRMTYLDTYSDEDKVAVFGFDIEDDVTKDLNWVDWPQLAGYLGLDEDELLDLATSDDPMDRAHVYIDAGRYHGFVNLDNYQDDMTIEEATKKYGDDVDAAHEAWKDRRRRNPFAEIKQRLLAY